MKKTILLLLVLIFQYAFSQNLKIVFRYDDFMLQHDSVNEQVVRTFQKHNIPLVLGVIPCDNSGRLVLDNDYLFINILKPEIASGGVEIALHGYNHAKVSTNGEFVNVPTNEQYRRMRLGKHYLDSIFQRPTTTFIPPWNAYDENTLSVMEKLDMKIISSSLTLNQPYNKEKIYYFPHTIGNPALLIPVIESNKNRSGVIVLMFHSYDINSHFTIKELDDLLSVVSKYNVHFTTFKGLLTLSEKSDSKRIQSNIGTNLLHKMLRMKGVLFSTKYAVIIRILNVLLYQLIILFLFFVPVVLLPSLWKKNRKKIIFAGFILLLIGGISVWFHLIGPNKLLLILSGLAILGGSLVSMILNRNLRKNET